MRAITEYSDYKEFLLDEFHRRIQKNRRYSLRAFSRDLSLRPAALSDIMNGRYGLSSSLARIIAGNLNLSEPDCIYFVTLVELKHGRSSAIRAAAEKRIRKFRGAVGGSLYSQADESLFGEWYYTPVLELVSILGSDSSEEEISLRLSIDVSKVEQALRVLLGLRLIEKAGAGYRRLSNYNAVERVVPNETLRAFHKTYLHKAVEAMSEQDVGQRKALTTVFGFSLKAIEEARTAINLASDQFVEKFERTSDADCVYALSVHLFRVDKPVE